MKLQKNLPAPAFTATDVFGTSVSLNSLQGKKVYLAFMRFAGCPICNLRVHELLKNAEAFKEKNIQVLLVYESPASRMREYLEGESYPFTFIADPENRLYDLYSVETSWSKLFSSMFHGMMGKFFAGNKLFKKKIAMDGKNNRMEAEFLISEKGTLSIAHYSAYLGENVSIDVLLNA